MKDSYSGINRNNGHDSPENPVPHRVISLVPSITESLFDLGFGESVVGITDFCIHPADQLAELPRLGGPGTIRRDELMALHPDLVIANQEENPKELVQYLRGENVPVMLTFPKTVRETVAMLWDLIHTFRSEKAGLKVALVEMTLDWALEAKASQPEKTYFCPVWQESPADGAPYWVTFNQETYSSDLLSLLGGRNVFADRTRRYPLEADLGTTTADSAEPAGGRDTRYPRVSREEIIAADPEVIILPSEPYAFSEADRAEIEATFSDTRAVRDGRVYLIDGTLTAWYGTRLARALQELPELFS